MTPEIKMIEDRLKHIESVLRAVGLPADPWMSPGDAATVLKLSRRAITDRIHRAEKLRIARKKVDCKYGIHYRNDAEPDASYPIWKVNLNAWRELLNSPPEERIT